MRMITMMRLKTTTQTKILTTDHFTIFQDI